MPAVIDHPRNQPKTITDRWFPLRPHAKQSAAWRTRSRFVCLPCGRQSGKTELSLRRLVRYLPVDRGYDLTRYAYLGPTRPQAKRIAWDALKTLTPRAWMIGLPRETDLIIRCGFRTHVAEIHVIGMDHPARFEGPGWDGVVSDESSDQKPKLDLAVRPAIDSRLGWWWMIGIPKRQGIGARRYRQYCEKGLAGEEGWETHSWPSWDIMPAEAIEAARRDMDLKDFNEQYGAAWESVGGAAFHAFDARVHVRPCQYDPQRPMLIGSDFNVNPMAWVCCQATTDGTGLEAFDEVWLRDTNTQRTLDVLWDRYGATHKGGFIFYGDASGQSRHTSAAASDYAQIKNDRRFRSRVAYPSKNPGIKNRLASCNALFHNAAGQVRCWIDPRCQQLIADLEHRGLDKDGLPVQANADGGHITDAIGYLIHAKWPVTRVEYDDAQSIGVYYGEH